MAGWPIAQVRRPDGMVFTLYHGAEHPFIHALSSVDAWALCIDLPATGGDDPAAAADWGLTATVDGTSIVAANATLGVAVEIPLSDLAIAPERHVRPVGVDRDLPGQVRPRGGWRRRSPGRRLPARIA